MICILQKSNKWIKKYHNLKIAKRAVKIPKIKTALHCFSGILGVLVFWSSFFAVLGYLGNPELAITSNLALIYAEFQCIVLLPLVSWTPWDKGTSSIAVLALVWASPWDLRAISPLLQSWHLALTRFGCICRTPPPQPQLWTWLRCCSPLDGFLSVFRLSKHPE